MDEAAEPARDHDRELPGLPAAAWAPSGPAPSRGRIEDAPIFKVTAAIADAVSPDEVYEALVDRVADAVGASSAGLWLVSGDGEAATLVRSRGYSSESESAMRALRVDSAVTMPVLDCIRSAAPLWIPSQAAFYALYPHLSELATRHRSYRISCLPLIAHERVLGSLCLTIEEPGDASDAEKEFLLLIARYATQAIERLRLYEAERDSRGEADEARTRAEQLFRFAEAVVGADRVEVVYEAALDSIEAALGVSRAAVLTTDDESVMRFRAWRGLSDGYRAAVEGHSPWPKDAVAPQPVVVSDALSDAAWASFERTLRDEGIGALAFIPLVSRGRLLGKFMLYYARPHAFSPVELETARAIANHLGSVIARFRALASLEETLRSNELFAGVLAHDLRTPLSAILGSAQLLLLRQEGAASAARGNAKPVGRIIASGQRMNTMIGQLLDFTHARSGGGIRIDRRETDLEEVYAQAVGELELVRPEWAVRCDAAGDLLGTWDPERLVQVLSNLVSNAGQHGRPAEPIHVTLDGNAADHVRVEVHNAGAVAPAVLPHLFDPFRTSRHRRGQSSGLGLGLFIVREIVRAHGGAVEVSSSEPVGTTVSIRLPR